MNTSFLVRMSVAVLCTAVSSTYAQTAANGSKLVPGEKSRAEVASSAVSPTEPAKIETFVVTAPNMVGPHLDVPTDWKLVRNYGDGMGYIHYAISVTRPFTGEFIFTTDRLGNLTDLTPWFKDEKLAWFTYRRGEWQIGGRFMPDFDPQAFAEFFTQKVATVPFKIENKGHTTPDENQYWAKEMFRSLGIAFDEQGRSMYVFESLGGQKRLMAVDDFLVPPPKLTPDREYFEIMKVGGLWCAVENMVIGKSRVAFIAVSSTPLEQVATSSK